MLIIGECVGCLLPKVCGYTSNCKIHLCQLICGIRILLSINRYFLLVTVVCLYELHGLYEHTTGTTARIIKSSIIWLYKLSYQINDALRCIEFSLTFAFSNSKLAQEVFIYPSDNVIFNILGSIYLIDLVKQRCQFRSINLKPRIIIIRQSSF